MSTPTLNIPQDAVSSYREHGYYLAKGVLPPELLAECRSTLEAWVDAQAERWLSEGLITDKLEHLDFMHRFPALLKAAGEPTYARSIRKDFVHLSPRQVFAIHRHDALLDLAETFLGTNEIISHGVWNVRPKAPSSKWTDTPWHQDGQYFRKQAHIHIMTIWFPLHDVTEDSGCLAVSPDFQEAKLYQDYKFDDHGYIGIRREESEKLPRLPVAMEAGDALCFPQLTPHCAMPNNSDVMRWSMDMRFVATDEAMPPALDLGMVSRSSTPSRLTPFEEWFAKWEAPDAW